LPDIQPALSPTFWTPQRLPTHRARQNFLLRCMYQQVWPAHASQRPVGAGYCEKSFAGFVCAVVNIHPRRTSTHPPGCSRRDCSELLRRHHHAPLAGAISTGQAPMQVYRRKISSTPSQYFVHSSSACNCMRYHTMHDQFKMTEVTSTGRTAYLELLMLSRLKYRKHRDMCGPDCTA
jgi:hypothetical protein